MRDFVYWLICGLMLVIGLVLMAHKAFAATCLMWPDLQSALTTRYGEAPVFVGRGKQLGQEVAVYAAPQGTWTLIVRQTNGLACVLGAGKPGRCWTQP
ncbi:hypothetical protein EGN72_02535 [Pseudorhodobacter sp. E13]|uniref:hypothetical protein n=1 Tax=Pseudorhodobacter sp. E13 TaxID=2487931 RepID=UPI000F8DBFFF|nr:hypothetical protein [Pseudorhodobacter sp. E13]RUS64888.1 hypothetical protein EGN72_02535 [Pseudorhodobacter sp. E13]